MSVTKVKENVRRISRKREFEQTKRTEGCLLATCLKRINWMKNHSGEMPLSECDTSCCYHPNYVPKTETSTGRSRTRGGHSSAINQRINHKSTSLRREAGSWSDPSPF